MPPTNPRRKLGGPCVHPHCSDPTTPSGQWKFLYNNTGELAKKADEQITELLFDKVASCVCKKSACQRWAGFKDEPKQPGRPAKFTKLSIPMARALTSAETLPRLPILQRIDEIWGMRFRRV